MDHRGIATGIMMLFRWFVFFLVLLGAEAASKPRGRPTSDNEARPVVLVLRRTRGNTVGGGTYETSDRLNVALEMIKKLDRQCQDLVAANATLREAQDRDATTIRKLQEEIQQLSVESKLPKSSCDILQSTCSSRLDNVEKQITSIVLGVINMTQSQLAGVESRVDELVKRDGDIDGKGQFDQLAEKILALEQEQLRQRADIDTGIDNYKELEKKMNASEVHPCVDRVDNCVDLVTTDPDFCGGSDNNDCAFTCSLCDDITPTCTVLDVANADIKGEVRSVTRGQVVEYSCHREFKAKSGDAKRICLPSGLLSGTDLNCVRYSKSCEAGWTVFTRNGVKTCYKESDDKVYFPFIKDRCQAMGAEAATIMSEEENTFLNNLKTGEIWLPLTDVETMGNWVWNKWIVTNYTNWAPGKPKNDGNYGHCVKMMTNGMWVDVPCNNHFKCVCMKPAVDMDWCQDDPSASCAASVLSDPDYCARMDRYNCVYTCGVCKQNETPKCDVPSHSNAENRDGKTSVSRGDVVSCMEGHLVKTGHDKRVCLASGSLSGSVIQCVRYCEDGWAARVENGVKMCYKFINAKTSVNYAKKGCQAMNAEMADVKTKVENDYLKTIIIGEVWMPITDGAKEGTWVWDDGTVATYTNWDFEQPDNWRSGEDCAHLRTTGKWNDVPCSYKYAYVCKKPGVEIIS